MGKSSGTRVSAVPTQIAQVTEGPHAGKLALIDFGLVSELPASDREAMVSATIHLGNRDWNALITDFIALGFLPADADRGLIIPVMEKVLSPYLRGGGAKAFNFQACSCQLPLKEHLFTHHRTAWPSMRCVARCPTML